MLSNIFTDCNDKHYSFTQYSYGDDQDGSKGVHSYPLDYVYPGNISMQLGRLYYQSVGGYYWAITIQNIDGSTILHTWGTVVRSAAGYGKIFGNNLRCIIWWVPIISSSSAMAMVKMEVMALGRIL